MARRQFTPSELTIVVLLIVGIATAVAIPVIKARTAQTKWSGAHVAAAVIQRAVRDYAVQMDVATARTFVAKNLADKATQQALGFQGADLEATHFTACDYTIVSVDDAGHAVIAVKGSKPNAPDGWYQLLANGEWAQQAETSSAQQP